MAVCGPTSCGKTYWVYLFMKEIGDIWVCDENVPIKILYCFGIDQEIYGKIRQEFSNVVFYQGLPSLEYIYEMSEDQSLLVVLDDLVYDVLGNMEMLKLFTQGMHHKNVSVIFMTQNIFQQGKHARTIALNVKYLVLFENPRDNYQIQFLGRQIFPGRSDRLLEAYHDAVTFRRWGYLLIDLSSGSDDSVRLRSNVLLEESEPMVIYYHK